MTKNTTTATCTTCGAEYSAKRAALGYKTCLKCGEAASREVKFTIGAPHKQGYMVITNKAELVGLNNKTIR